VVRANIEAFSDLFASRSQVEEHLSPLIGPRNELAHPQDRFVSGKVRSSGEREVRWFAERLGVEIDIVPPPRL
jgi:hypothetical protein